MLGQTQVAVAVACGEEAGITGIQPESHQDTQDPDPATSSRSTTVSCLPGRPPHTQPRWFQHKTQIQDISKNKPQSH